MGESRSTCPPLLQVFTGAVIVSPLLVSIVWCLYNAIPPILLFTYSIAGRNFILSFMCALAMVVSTACVITSLGFIWWIQVRIHKPSTLNPALPQLL